MSGVKIISPCLPSAGGFSYSRRSFEDCSDWEKRIVASAIKTASHDFREKD
jgi:hypothetical protein